MGVLGLVVVTIISGIQVPRSESAGGPAAAGESESLALLALAHRRVLALALAG